MQPIRPTPFQAFNRFALALSILTFVLIVLGATVRAMGAGLACPDWPLCHGQLIPPMDPQIFIEWFHRLIAGIVSMLFLGMTVAVLALRELRQHFLGLTLAAVCLLFVQIVLGGLTVLHLLAFETVTLHLATGTLFLATLVLITARARRLAGGRRPAGEAPLQSEPAILAPLALITMGATFGQILLGGLVSSQYAALACPDFPTCQGMLFPPLEGGVGIHMVHRYGAYTLSLLVAALMLVGGRSSDVALRRGTLLAFALLVIQVGLGIANVLLRVPVPLSAAHLGVAELLFVTLLGINLVLQGAWRRAGAVRPAIAR